MQAPSGHESLRPTGAGIAALAETLQRNRARREAHEALVVQVAEAMTRAGQLAAAQWVAQSQRQGPGSRLTGGGTRADGACDWQSSTARPSGRGSGDDRAALTVAVLTADG